MGGPEVGERSQAVAPEGGEAARVPLTGSADSIRPDESGCQPGPIRPAPRPDRLPGN